MTSSNSSGRIPRQTNRLNTTANEHKEIRSCAVCKAADFALALFFQLISASCSVSPGTSKPNVWHAQGNCSSCGYSETPVGLNYDAKRWSAYPGFRVNNITPTLQGRLAGLESDEVGIYRNDSTKKHHTGHAVLNSVIATVCRYCGEIPFREVQIHFISDVSGNGVGFSSYIQHRGLRNRSRCEVIFSR